MTKNPTAMEPEETKRKLHLDKFVWSDMYSVGIPLIDGQHKRLLHMLEEVRIAVIQNRANEIIARLLSELASYCGEHFESEELVMEITNYPAKDHHSQIHQTFSQTVVDWIQQFEADSLQLADVMNVVNTWIYHHIGEEDKKIGVYLQQAGISTEQLTSVSSLATLLKSKNNHCYVDRYPLELVLLLLLLPSLGLFCALTSWSQSKVHAICSGISVAIIVGLDIMLILYVRRYIRCRASIARSLHVKRLAEALIAGEIATRVAALDLNGIESLFEEENSYLVRMLKEIVLHFKTYIPFIPGTVISLVQSNLGHSPDDAGGGEESDESTSNVAVLTGSDPVSPITGESGGSAGYLPPQRRPSGKALTASNPRVASLNIPTPMAMKKTTSGDSIADSFSSSISSPKSRPTKLPPPVNTDLILHKNAVGTQSMTQVVGSTSSTSDDPSLSLCNTPGGSSSGATGHGTAPLRAISSIGTTNSAGGQGGHVTVGRHHSVHSHRSSVGVGMTTTSPRSGGDRAANYKSHSPTSTVKDALGRTLQKKTISVLVSEVSNFPILLTSMGTHQLLQLQGAIVSILETICKATRGVLVSLYGDRFVICWNATNSVGNYSEQACNAALLLQKTLQDPSQKLFPEPILRTGVSSGPAYVGNMGSTTKMSFCMIGPVPHLATSLCELNENLQTRILVCHRTRSEVGHLFVMKMAVPVSYSLPSCEKFPAELISSPSQVSAIQSPSSLVVNRSRSPSCTIPVLPEFAYELVSTMLDGSGEGEWMYVMQKSAALHPYAGYHDILTHVLGVGAPTDKVGEGLSSWESYVFAHPEDFVSKLLFQKTQQVYQTTREQAQREQQQQRPQDRADVNFMWNFDALTWKFGWIFPP